MSAVNNGWLPILPTPNLEAENVPEGQPMHQLPVESITPATVLFVLIGTLRLLVLPKKLPSATELPFKSHFKPSCVCIADVTPLKYPSSVAVTDECVGTPLASLTSALLAVIAAASLTAVPVVA
jgi:hypothetical protein